MEPPPVQYVATSDGYNLACSTVGEGSPLVFLPWSLSNHCRRMWTLRTFSHAFECLSQTQQLVQYDGRGQGLSTRGLTEASTLDDLVIDLETVVDGLGLGRVALFGGTDFGKVAIRYATRHPERVTALILWNAYVHRPGYAAAGTGKALVAANWEFLVEVVARTGFPQEDFETAARIVRESHTASDFLTLIRITQADDVRSELAQIQAPTLVLATRASAWSFATEDASMDLAASIRGARFAIHEDAGGGIFSLSNETPAAIKAIREFVAAHECSGVDILSPFGSSNLSSRETEVIRLMVAGRSNQQIADELVISLNTVRRHVSNIFAKTGAANRADAVTYAHRNGLV